MAVLLHTPGSPATQQQASWQFQVIGRVHSPFKQKFGIPRQPGLVHDSTAMLEMLGPYQNPSCYAGLENYSHLWLIFCFHAHVGSGWRPTVRPPRFGGKRRVGVFASRSPYRPNPLGLSLVKLLRIEVAVGVRVWISGADLLDGTPILDIKPYLPDVEAHPLAHSFIRAEAGRAVVAKRPLNVQLAPAVVAQCAALEPRYPGLEGLIKQTLAQDPRPAYHDDPQRQYGICLYDLNILWRVADQLAYVISVDPWERQ